MPNEFPIKITGDASSLVAASQQTNTALGSTKTKLAELTPEQNAHTAAMGTGGKALQEHAKDTEEVATKTGFLNLKKTELKKLTRELAHEFPIAGLAAKLMMNPIVAGLTIAIGVFGAAKKALDDWNAKLDAAAAQNASKDFLPGIEAKKAALDAAKVSAADFAVAIANIGKAEDKFKTSIAQAIDKLHEFTNAQAEVNSSGEAKELAEVDLKQKSGKLDEVGAIKARAGIKERYRKIQDDLKTKGEQDEVKLQETELQHDKASQQSLMTAAQEARKKRDGLKARRAQAEKDLEEGKKKQAEYDTEYEEAQTAADEAGTAEGLVGSGEVPGESVGVEADARLEEAKRKRDLQRKFNERTKALMKSIDEQRLPGAEGDASVAETRAKSNADRVDELERTLPGKREVLGIRQQGRAVAGKLKDETTELETTGRITDEKNQGDDKLGQLQKQIVQAAQSGKRVSEETLEALRAQESHNLKVAKELAEQSKRLRAIEAAPPRI